MRARRLVYLAVPYSSPDPAVREHRFHLVNQAAAALMRQGIHVFSPISHTHPILTEGELPTGFDYWEEYDRAMLGACCALVVLAIEGWNRSVGVAREIEIAKEMGLPIFTAASVEGCASEAASEWLRRCEEDQVSEEAERIERCARKLEAQAEGMRP